MFRRSKKRWREKPGRKLKKRSDWLEKENALMDELNVDTLDWDEQKEALYSVLIQKRKGTPGR